MHLFMFQKTFAEATSQNEMKPHTLCMKSTASTLTLQLGESTGNVGRGLVPKTQS